MKPSGIHNSNFRHKALGLSIERYFLSTKVIQMTLSWMLLENLRTRREELPLANYVSIVFEQLEPKDDEVTGVAFMCGEEYNKTSNHEYLKFLVAMTNYGMQKREMQATSDFEQIEVQDWFRTIRDFPTLKAGTTPPDDLDLKSSMEIL